MSAIESYYLSSLASQAAYADIPLSALNPDGSISDADVSLALKVSHYGDYTEAQAAYFISKYKVWNQFTDSATGFSAILIQEKGGDAKYILAFRGTQGDLLNNFDPLDAYADSEVLSSVGVAREQVLSMLNYYYRLTAPASSEVIQYVYQPISDTVVSEVMMGGGLGYLSDIAPGSLNIAGHSLGGHLATVFYRAFSDTGQIGNVYTYNGLGIRDSGVETWLSKFGLSSNIAGDINITNIIAETGIDVVPNLADQKGKQQFFFIEEDVGIPNHSIVRLTDALAVANLLTTIDPSLDANDNGMDVQQLTQILYSASNLPDNSLEVIVNAVGEIYQAGEYVEVGDRGALYTRIKEINESPLLDQSIGLANIVSMSGISPESSVVAATADAGILYALERLDSFAVTGDPGLYPGLDAGEYTHQYLLDRAYLLENQLIRAASDYPLTEYGSEFDGQGQEYIDTNLHFVDVETGYDAWKYHKASLLPRVTIAFGGAADDDQLIGTNESDHLYGRGGDDILIQSANGTDDNQLDYMEGGEGDDVYIVGGGDKLRDLDGIGSVVFNGFVLHTGLGGAGEYQSIQPRFTYGLSGETLTVTDAVENETLTIEGFSNGDLGITLVDTQQVNKAQSIVTLGRHDTVIDTDDDGSIINGDSVDMVETIGLIQDATPTSTSTDPLIGNHYDFANAIDEIHTGAGKDNVTITDINNNPDIWFFGGADNDTFLALGVDDGSGSTESGATVYGESGDDDLTGSYLADCVDGGSDHDLISGGGGDDILLGDVGNDLVFGGDGQDDILGGEDNDWLYGGGQSDYIEGGSGDDKIYGDTDIGAVVDATGATRRSIRTWDGVNEAVGFYPADSWWILPENQSVLDLPVTQDVPSSEAGDDLLSGGAGKDSIFGGGGNDEIYGGDDKDQLYGEAGDDRIFGDTGDDVLFGDIYSGQYNYDQQIEYTAYSASLDLTVNQIRRQYQDPVDVVGNDILEGGAGIDRLYGGGGNDVLDGGADNDLLDGAVGDDSYVFNVDWGRDTIREEDGADTIRFGAGILATDITVTANDNDLGLSDQNGNEIHIEDWYSGSRIEQVVFSDGSSWTEADLTAAAQHQTGDEGDNELRGIYNEPNVLDGAAGDDRLTGGSQADTLIGGDGNDVLEGRGGDDQLLGGAGIDTYILGNDAGNVVLQDDTTDGSVNTIRFAEGLQITDITSTQSGSDLVLNWSAVAGSATIKGYYDNPAAWRFELDAGLSVPNAFVDNQAELSIIEEERRAYQDTLNSDLLTIKQSPAPVTGNVWISAPQAGPPYDLLAYGDDLTLGIGYSGLALTINSTSLKHETTIAVNEIQGTADADVLQPDMTETYQSYNQEVYLWLTDVTQTSDTTYTATIEKSSYTRPAFCSCDGIDSVRRTVWEHPACAGQCFLGNLSGHGGRCRRRK